MTGKFALVASFGAAVLLAQPGPPPPGDIWIGGARHAPGIMMAMGPASRTPITGAPYSAVETVQVQQTLAGGNQIQRQNESKVYRDSQGRVRTEHTFMPPPAAASQSQRTMITIFDPVAGYVYRLDPENKTVHQLTVRSRSGATEPPPEHVANSKAQTDDLGTQIVNGVMATGKRTTITIPAGAIGNTQPIQVVREAWISQDLKVPVLIKSSDPRFGNTTMQLTNIVRGEPDPSLFHIPSGYTTVNGFGGDGNQRRMMRQHMRPSR